MNLGRVLLLSLAMALAYNLLGQSGETIIVRQKLRQPAAATTSAPSASDLLLFGTASCTYCAQARLYFERRGIAYIDYRIDTNPAAAALYQKLGGQGGVPYLVQGKRSLTGFNPQTFEDWRTDTES